MEKRGAGQPSFTIPLSLLHYGQELNQLIMGGRSEVFEVAWRKGLQGRMDSLGK